MAKRSSTVEVLRSWIYDTVRFQKGRNHSSVRFFEVPLGGKLSDGTVKTYAHTNMERSAMFPEHESFKIRAVLAVLDRGHGFSEKDSSVFMQAHCGLFINQKVYPDYFPARFLIDTDKTMPAKPGEILKGRERPVSIKDIVAAVENERKAIVFDDPFSIAIDPLENFWLEMVFDRHGYTPSHDLDLMIIFLGDVRREVL